MPTRRTLIIILLIILFLFLGVFYHRYEQLQAFRPSKSPFLATVLSFFELDINGNNDTFVAPDLASNIISKGKVIPRSLTSILGISEVVSGVNKVYAEGNSFILEQGASYDMRVRLFNVPENGNLDYIVHLTRGGNSYVLAEGRDAIYVNRSFVTSRLSQNSSVLDLPLGNYEGKLF